MKSAKSAFAAILIGGMFAAGPVLAQTGVRTAGDRIFDASALTLAALNIADYITTRDALKYPGVHESNPWLKNLVKNPTAFAALKIGLAVGSYFGLKSLYRENRTLAWVISAASNFALAYVVCHNVGVIREARAR